MSEVIQIASAQIPCSQGFRVDLDDFFLLLKCFDTVKDNESFLSGFRHAMHVFEYILCNATEVLAFG